MPYLWLLLLFASAVSDASETPAVISLGKPWKREIYQFADKLLQHSAWGIAHYQRNYLLTQKIAEQENIPFDSEVVFAAAFLHDLGVFPPYQIDDAEHSQTAVDNIESILLSVGFPMEKIPAVNALILGHMFYSEPGKDKLAQAFHDADTLDFLGTIGITRILSMTTRHRWAEGLTGALNTIERFHTQLPAKLKLTASKKLAQQRVNRAERFIQNLKAETRNGSAL
ncbi:phosphohydrolase [Thalassotalea insulae]|uniref:Phosphohydrolase n=1 Tax=Thalassotalea insulae TaxID=2056778 RepID=A0ABQ6GVA4_9GAMM|nr:HD domain-containing protein [Thalassotalea insulae]GLX78572.1 phosphohydrolase [Thalassotalea insulae]